MSETYFRTFRSDEMRYLARKHPNAFILLTFIADRARRENGHPDGLTIGQCHIGDYKEYGLTEKEYRTAKKVLEDRKHIKIIETCRTRKSERAAKKIEIIENVKNWADKRATRVTTTGTLVELCSLTIYDINTEHDNQLKGDRKGDRGATEGRPKGDEQEDIRSISPKVDIQEIAQPAEQLRSKDSLSFDFEKGEFVGITETEAAEWRIAYPHIDLHAETIKAKNWIKSNPSKSKKTLWRKFLTGWYGRANDTIENKKAFRSASSSGSADRRTKDIQGNPVESPYDGKF